MLARLWVVGFLAAAAAAAETPIIIELFTSEGCSSCPPADDLLARLDSGTMTSGRPGAFVLPAGVEIIALGEHVDYWDQLGWRDRFSSPLFSARQQDYGLVFRTDSVYTPQVVVHGQYQYVGSDWRGIREGIQKAAREPKALVALSMTSGQTIRLVVGKLPPGSHESDLLLAVTEGGNGTTVYAGENSGRTLRHAAVVRSITSLGRLDPKYPGEYSAEARLNLRPEWNRQYLKLVLFVQDRTNRRILGAATARP